jgi:hypothetical protein
LNKTGRCCVRLCAGVSQLRWPSATTSVARTRSEPSVHVVNGRSPRVGLHRPGVNGGISGRDFEQAELQQLNAAQFQAQVRNKRILQQADQSVTLQNGTLISKINGRNVTAKVVTGTTRFG